MDDLEHLDWNPAGTAEKIIDMWCAPIRPALKVITDGKCGERPVGQLTTNEVLAYATIFMYAFGTGWIIGGVTTRALTVLARPVSNRTYL